MERLVKQGSSALLSEKKDVFFRAEVITETFSVPVPFPTSSGPVFAGSSTFNDAIFKRMCSLAGVYFAQLPFSPWFAYESNRYIHSKWGNRFCDSVCLHRVVAVVAWRRRVNSFRICTHADCVGAVMKLLLNEIMEREAFLQKKAEEYDTPFQPMKAETLARWKK